MSTTPAPLHLEVADLPVVLRFAPAAEPDRGTAAIAAQLAGEGVTAVLSIGHYLGAGAIVHEVAQRAGVP